MVTKIKSLLTLKDYMTIEQVVKGLNLSYDNDLLEVDVLQYALEGSLQLSLHTKNELIAKKCEFVSKSEYDTVSIEVGPETEEVCYRRFGDNYIKIPNEICHISGTFDLWMVGNERLDIAHKVSILQNGICLVAQELGGTFIRDESGSLYLLQMHENQYKDFTTSGSRVGDSEELRHINNIKKYKFTNCIEKDASISLSINKEYSCVDAVGLPSSAILVVRPSELQEFEYKINAAQDPKRTNSLSILEKNSLLTIILGMAMDKYKYDPNKSRNDATGDKNGSISAGLQKQSLSMDSDTIRKYLKESHELL